MGKTNFEYDETGNTYYYVFLTFLGLVLIPATYYFWPSGDDDDEIEKRKKSYLQAAARDSVYAQACLEKASRMGQKDPWLKTKRRSVMFLLLSGWAIFAMIIYQISLFDYEMANFDPYEILQVGLDSTPKEIKKKYRELSLIYHPDKPTGDEKLFMKLTKAYNSLTDETAKYNWEHYGNPDGPQAMQFGIGLPAWLVEEKYSIWVLGVYTLIFMIGLPTAIYYWWSNSAKFSGEQVLLDTTQLYYYFFHKTPHMMLKRVLMVLAASLEFEKGHNSEIVERPTDNLEIPQLMKSIPNLGVNNKEKPLCFGYSVKARALLFAHLSRITLPMKSLHQDRLYVIKKGPFLVQEMVTCISQLILLAHAGRIGRLPSLDTIEYAMKLSPMIVQALWDKASPLLQLPHIEEDQLNKHFHSRKRNIKSLQQLAKMKDEDRRSLLRTLTEEQYKDVIRVLAMIPVITLEVTTEVVDDEEQHIVTAGAIITVTVVLGRKTLEREMSGLNALQDNAAEEAEDREADDDLPDDMVELSAPGAGDDSESNATALAKEEADKKKAPVWKKPEKKKKAGKKGGGGSKQKQKAKKKTTEVAVAEGDKEKAQDEASESKRQRPSKHRRKTPDDGSGSDDDDASGSDSDNENDNEKAAAGSNNDPGQSTVEEEDEEAEWEKFQKKMNKREKALEGKSRISHSVHSPYFTDDKQEFWWVYISDRKNHALVTPPNAVTSLREREEVELKFTAPQKPGHYSFTVCVRSDSYLGVDVQEDIKLDVQEAREAPTEHPQWEFEDDEDEEDSKDEDSDDEFATDDEFDDDDDDNDD